MRPLLVLRPEPGAAATLARAVAAGFDAVAAPLFTVAPIAWAPPDPRDFDALMLTSAHAVRLAGPALARFHPLPVFAVGEATALAALSAGFARVEAGAADAAALVARMAGEGVAHALHLAGREHRRIDDAPVRLTRVIVYGADPVPVLPAAARAALATAASAQRHSPRGGAVLADLVARAGIDAGALRVAAISASAARGW
ncbi:uroporphyrinogen-III synthase, partial [Sphingomonas sp.]|uniref:uroporphyrinogen-III synthase n=1 Tax=Sphingomonas sp. TaxID=28214 RepID=UPI003B3B1E6F